MSDRKYEFIKYEIRLLNDPRFFELEPIDQLTYFKMLGLAKALNNKIPNNLTTLKALLRDKRDENEINLTLEKIKSKFPKLKSNKHFHYFVGFRARHKMGIVQDPQSKSKSKIESKRREYIQYFLKKHKEVAGCSYITTYGKDDKHVNELLDAFTYDELIELTNEFFETAKDPKEWHADKLSIGVFRSVIPQLIGKLRKK